MRTAGSKQLKVRVARKDSFSDQPPTAGRAGSSGGLAQPAPDQVLSDEEVAWRLHQELNATSPILRTRSRKVPDQFGQPKSSSGAGSGSLDGAPSKSRTAAAAGGAARTRSVNKAPVLGPASAVDAQGDVQEAQLVADTAAVRDKAEPVNAAVEAGVKPELMEHDGGEDPGRRSPFARAAAQAFSPPEGDSHSMKEEVLEDVPALVAAAAGPPEPAAGDKPSTKSSPAEPPTAPEAARDAPAAVQHHGSSPSSAAQQGTSSSDGAALAERVGGGGRGEASSAEDPANTADAGPAVTRRRKGGAERAAAAAAAQQQAAVVKREGPPAPVAAAAKGRARGRLPKIPKLPMVRQEDDGWYRARLLQDAGDKVLLEFTGFEGQFAPIWLPRTSDRIWRGSYKGKDWKHLGGGAWEPKTKSSSGRRGRGGKRKRDVGLSSGPVGPSQEDSQDQEEESDDEDFDEAESGHPAEQQAEQPAPEPQPAAEPRQAGSRPSVKAEPLVAAVPKEEEPQPPQRLGSGRGRGRGGKKAVQSQRPQRQQRRQEEEQLQQQAQEERHPEDKVEPEEAREEPVQVAEEVAEMDVDEKEPPKKKAKRSMGRKRLDPIVRDALLAMDQGPSTEENSEEPAGPSNPREQAQSTPPAWKGSWKQHQRMAVQALEDAVMAEVEQQQQQGGGQPGQPHLTPTPETPITRLGKRSSLTPGAFLPLSPRAAAAAAAAIDAAGPASPRHRGSGGAAEAPLSPQARQRAQQGADASAAQSAATPRAAASAAAQEQAEEPGEEQAPLSPRHRFKASHVAAAAATDGPVGEVDELPSSPRQTHGYYRRQRSLKQAAATAAAAAASAKASEEEGESGDVPEEAPRAAAGGGGGRGRRGRKASQRPVVEQPAESGSEDGGGGGVEQEGTGSESQEEAAPKPRPRRQSRKAAIYKDADFAFGEEVEEAEQAVVAATAALVLEPTNVPDGEAPAQPARRRRKPLVCSPAPLDVGLPELVSGSRKGLPAALAVLDVLPVPPAVAVEGNVAVTAAGQEHFGGQQGDCTAMAAAGGPAVAEEGEGVQGAADVAMTAAIGGLDGPVDDEEAAAVAALADLPSPRAALAAQRAQQAQHEAQQAAQRYRAQQAVQRAARALDEEEALAAEADDGEAGAEDDGDDDYAPPPRRREGPLEAPHHGSGSLRKRSAPLPMSLDHVRGGRVHKLHNASSGGGGVVPLSRHFSLSHADRQHSASGKRAGHHQGSGYGQGHGHGTHYKHSSHSSHHRLHYWGSGHSMHHKANGSDGRGLVGYRRSGSLDRAGSLGLPAGLDGLTVAQGMFGTILSALKKFSLDDTGGCVNGSSALSGYASGGGGGGGGLNGGIRRGSEGGSGLEHSNNSKEGGGGGHPYRHQLSRSGGGGGGNGRQQLHLFSSAWSYSKWHNGGEPHPSILSIQPDLFSKVCGANGGSAALFSLGMPSPAVIPDMHCAAPKPPLPLFC